MNKKNLEIIWNQVPPNYYEEGLRKNIFQYIWHTNKLKTFKKLTLSKEYKNILDVGCAAGTLTNKISQLFPGSQISAVDAYNKSINLGKKLYPHIKFIKADAHKLPFRNNLFDLVYCCETIEHVQVPHKVLQEIKRVLKRDGQAIVMMDSGSTIFRVVWWLWEKTKGKVWNNAHLHPFHHNELEIEIKKTGFKILKKHLSFFGMEVSFVLSK